MIANARMYSVTPPVAAQWKRFLDAVIERAGLAIDLVDHAPPEPISELWGRPDKAAVFMCGLPYSVATPQPRLLVAPVPSPPEYDGLPRYWSDVVVRADSPFERLEQTFGHRLALTTPESQSGYTALLHDLMVHDRETPLYRELIEPRFTPMGAMTAVIEKRADVAPLDSYAFALLRRSVPELTDQVRVIFRTEPTAIPIFVSSEAPAAGLAEAFLTAADDPAIRPLMDDLLLQRFVVPDPPAYDALRKRFETMQAFWRANRLAETIHPAFAAAFEG